MKKVLTITLMMFLVCGVCSASSTKIENDNGVDITSLSSVVISDDAVIKTGDGALYNVQLITQGAVLGDIIDLYDNITFAGATKVWSWISDGSDIPVNFSCPNGINLDTGLYSDMTLSAGLSTAKLLVVYK